MAENEQKEVEETQPDPTEQQGEQADETPDFNATDDAQGQQQAQPPAQPKDKQPWDRVRQEAQQEFGNKFRPFEEKYNAEIASLRATIETMASQLTPKEQRVAKDRLDELADANGTPIDPDETVPVVAKALQELREELRATKAQLAAQERRIAPAEQIGYERQWKSQFAKVNPDIADKSSEAYEQFVAEYSDIVGDGNGFSDDARNRIASRVFQGVVAKLKATPPASGTQTPSKSPKGAQIVPTGSRKAVAARDADDDGYPDFHASDE